MAALNVILYGGSALQATSPGGPAGAVDIQVINPDGQAASLAGGFTYIATSFPPPTLSTTAPSSGPVAGGTPITLTGANFLAGATVLVGSNAASNIVVANPNTISLTLPPGAAGAVNVQVRNPDGQVATLVNGFSYTKPSAPAPSISSVSPNIGPSSGGTAVKVVGANFQSGLTVLFGGIASPNVLLYGGTALQATTPATSTGGTVSVQVVNPDGQTATLAGGFSYPSLGPNAPSISGATPNSGPLGGGTAVKLIGTNFQVGTTVSFGGIPASVLLFGGTALQATSPPASSPGPVDIVLRNPDGEIAIFSGGFTYAASSFPPPTLNSVSPPAGPPAGGTPVVISGANFQAGATLSFGGAAAANVTVSSSTTILATTPAGSVGGAVVQVKNPDGQAATLPGSFTYVQPNSPAPTITSLSVSFGPAAGGTAVKIFGTNFQAHLNILFGGLPASSVLVFGGTVLQATTPAAPAGTVNVEVVNPDGQTGVLTNAYTFYGAPVVTSVSPNSGDTTGGIPVTLSGSSFQQGTQVLFGGVSATSVTVVGFSQIIAAPPAHAAGVVDVAVIGPDGQQASLPGSYTYATPGPLSPPSIFQDGFEEGDGSAFDYDSSDKVQVSYVKNPALCHSGNYCGEMTLQPSQSQVNVMWAQSLKNEPLKGYYSAWWKFRTDWQWDTSDVDMKAMILDNFPTRIYVNFRAISPSQSRIAIFNNLGPQQFFYYNQGGTEPLVTTDGQWHSLEVYVDQVTGSVAVWYDGNLFLTATGLPIGTVPFTQASFGAYVNGAASSTTGGPRSFYVDDIAISMTRIGTGATNRAQTTLFSDGFESGNFSNWAGPSTLTVTKSLAESGVYSALLPHAAGSLNNLSAETYFGDYNNKAPQVTEIYMDYDALVDSFSQSGAGAGGNGTKQVLLICNQDFQNLYPQPLPYAPFYVAVYFDSKLVLHGELHRRTTGNTDVVTDYAANIATPPFTLTRSNWADIRVHARLNTPGSSDGVLEIWQNGLLLLRYSNVNFRDSYTTRGWDMIQINGEDGAPPSQSWNQYWDNIRVFTVTP